MDGRLRGLIGGGEDIFFFSLPFGLPSPFSFFGPVFGSSGDGCDLIESGWELWTEYVVWDYDLRCEE